MCFKDILYMSGDMTHDAIEGFGFCSRLVHVDFCCRLLLTASPASNYRLRARLSWFLHEKPVWAAFGAEHPALNFRSGLSGQPQAFPFWAK